MMESTILWTYDYGTYTVRQVHSYERGTYGDSWWVRLDDDEGYTLQHIGSRIFYTEKNATIALLASLKSDKEETETAIKIVEKQLANLE